MGSEMCIRDRVYSDQCRVLAMKFLAFPAQLPPLRSRDVGECLSDFLHRTAEALKELHSLGYAHLDVRVPNICFYKNSNSYHVILIDVDRCREIIVQDVTGYVGEMYKYTRSADPCVPETWTTEHLDWKQLGLLAVRVLTEYKYSDEEIVTSFSKKSTRSPFTDQCLKKLIMDGKRIV